MWVHSRRRGWHSLALAALCAVAAGPAGAQILTSIQTPTPNSMPTQTVTAPDGTIWFVEEAADHIGTITPSYTYIGEVNLTLPGSRPTAITLDANGTAWFTESGLNKIGAYTRATDYLVEYQIPGQNGGLSAISVDAQGNVWFTESLTNQVGELNPSQLTINFVPLGGTTVGLQGIANDGFGNGWFTESQANQVGMLDLSAPTPTLSTYSGAFSGPWGISAGPSNNVWVTNQTGGFLSALNPNSSNLFQFPTVNGTNSQPAYIDSFQAQTGQNFVAWTEPTPGNGLVGLLNPSTGQTSQIQATNPNAAPFGISYGNNNTLWWSEANSSDLTGSFFNSSIVQRPPSVGGPILASLLGSFCPGDLSEAVLHGQTLRGFQHIRPLHVETRKLKRRLVHVMAVASRPGQANGVTLLLPNRATLGTKEARVLLAKYHIASLAAAPQKTTQTATINVITIGAPSQIKPQIHWFPAPATNAIMRVSAIDGAPIDTDQVTIGMNDCITLKLQVKFRTGQFWDVTNDPNTQFLLDPMRGHFTSKNVWCPNPEDYNHAFPIYGRLYSPDYGTFITSTIHVVVK